MTSGTKDSSIKDDLDAELPKIGLKRSKDPGLNKETHHNRDRHKEKRHHHRHHHHRHGHRPKEIPGKGKTYGDDLKFPKALKPLHELQNSNEENGKRNPSKIKKTDKDEWKKYVPPLFSVVTDQGSDKKEESYGERQRILYDKLYNTLNVKKHQKLYKAHQIKPKKSNLPRQQLKSSVLKSPKKKTKIKSNEQKKRKSKPNVESRNSMTRLRRPSEQSESSTCTYDSFSSDFSSSSSMCKSETESDSISDRLVSQRSGLDISDDELDRINANLTKKRRHKSLDQRRPVVVLKPLRSRSHSYVEKCNRQSDKVGLFDILEKEIIADSPSSIKCETEEQVSPPLDIEKQKETFEIFRNSLKKLRSEKRLSMSSEMQGKELSKAISIPELGAVCEEDDIESDKALYNEKVKLQVQILKQRMKSGIQKKIPHIHMKIDRHFLDILGEEKEEAGQDSELKDFTCEIDDSAEIAKDLSHISTKNEAPEESTCNDVIDLIDYDSPLPTIVRPNKVETYKPGKIKKEVVEEISEASDESPLPTIVTHYNVEAYKTNPVIPFQKMEINNIVETGKAAQIRKAVGKEIIEDFESPLPKITRSYNVDAYRKYPVKNEPENKEIIGNIQSSEYLSHVSKIVGNNDVEIFKAGQKHMEIEPKSMTVSNTVFNKHSPLLIKEPVNKKGENNFRDYELEEPQQYSELNIIQMPQVVADINLNNINLSKTNLYASSVPLHQIQLNEKNLYVSELPLVRIEISDQNAAIAQTGNDIDTWCLKNQILPVKDQPPITNFFAPVLKKVEDFKNSDQELTPNGRNQDSDNGHNKGLDIKGCIVRLERLNEERLSKMMKYASEKNSDSSENIESKILRRRDGRKRKVSCQRLISHTESSFSSQNRSSYSNRINLLECFKQQTRVSPGCHFLQDLPLIHTNICASLQDDGSRNLPHLLEFLYAFRYLKPNTHVVSQVIHMSFFCKVEKELVYETFTWLQEMNARFPGVIKVEWKVIERCLDIVQQRQITELAYLQAFLLLILLMEALKLDLFTKDLNEQRVIRQSMAYKIFQDIHSPYSRDLIKYLGLLLNKSQVEMENVTHASEGKYVFHGNITEIIQDLLEISVEVSSSCILQAGSIAENLKTLYKDLPGIERKTSMVNSIKSSLIRCKLTELLLESEYTGTSPLSANFPDSVLQIMECFFKAVPVTPVLGEIEFTSEHCEELAMLLYYMVTSYIQCCRCLTNESLRSRAVNYKSQDPITSTAIDETSLLLEYVEDFLDHLLSLNSELTPATEHYVQMLQCFSDLDS